jgi:hypothetical protein
MRFNKRMSNVFNNERGSVLIIALIITLALVTDFLVLSNVFTSAFSSKKKLDDVTILQTLEDSVIWSIENDEAWKATLAHGGASMHYLMSNGAVCPIATNSLDVFLEDGTTVLAHGDPASGNGFDYSGASCTGFSASIRNDKCPFAFSITWTPLCTGSCPPTLLSVTNGVAIDPKIQINIQILFSGNREDFLRINLAQRFQKQFTRGSAAGSLAASCRAAQGSFDPVLNTCQVTTATTCPPGQVFIGFETNGNAACRPNGFLNKSCGAGFAPVKINPGGGLECWKF